MQHATLVLPLFLLLGCAPAPGSPDKKTPPPPDTSEFRYETSREVDFRLRLEVDGTPEGGVHVQVVDVIPFPEGGEPPTEGITGNLYYQGVCDANGLVRSILRLPAAITEVDVVVTRPGARGPYSVPEWRSIWGPFAPAARWTVDVTDLTDLNVSLQGS